jgi:hypothetical protein
MNPDLLSEARRVARLTNFRVRIRIPSVLARGERFPLRLSLTGPDALPPTDFALTLHFQPSPGIEGLPPSVRLTPDEWSVEIPGLTATDAPVALAVARAEFDAPGADLALTSNPAWVLPDPPHRIFWGDLHIHSTFSNCHAWRCLPPEWAYTYARDASLLDFAAVADHLRGIASDPERWPRLQALARAFNDPGRFAAFLAFESSHAQGFGGDNNVYFAGDDAPHFWLDRDDMRGIAPEVPLQTLWQHLDAAGHPYFTAPHHTGRAGKFRRFDEPPCDPEREPLFEIYSSWGSSEMRHSRLPVSGGNNDAPSYFTDALRAGCRFGVIASSDDHATLPGAARLWRVEPFRPPTLNGHAHQGLAAVRAPRLDRAALYDALIARRTAATTGALALLEFDLDGAPADTLEIPADAALRARRTFRVRYTPHEARAATLFLVRNGEPFAAESVKGDDVNERITEVVFEDTDPIETVALRGARFHPEPFVVYYVRAEDSNGHHQWTSPLWLDL